MCDFIIIFLSQQALMCTHEHKLFFVLIAAKIWGNLISSLGFKTTTNKTITDEDLLKCGANFCPGSDDNNTNLEKPSLEKVFLNGNTYVYICLLLIILSHSC